MRRHLSVSSDKEKVLFWPNVSKASLLVERHDSINMASYKINNNGKDALIPPKNQKTKARSF